MPYTAEGLQYLEGNHQFVFALLTIYEPARVAHREGHGQAVYEGKRQIYLQPQAGVSFLPPGTSNIRYQTTGEQGSLNRLKKETRCADFREP